MSREKINDRPTTENPLLVGILVDVSGSMMASIRNRSGQTLNRLESFRDSLGDLISKAKDMSRIGSTEKIAPLLKIFAYGFGFGNPLSFLLGGQGEKVRDILEVSKGSSSTLSIDNIAENWPFYRRHVEKLATQMFGDTPMREGFSKVQKRFALERRDNQYFGQPVLFILSDGEPTDSSSDDILTIANQMKTDDILIISCYVTDKDITEPRHLYGKTLSNWPQGACLMFEASSILPDDSSFELYLKEYNWKIEEKGRLFTQINQSEILSEFMKVVLSPLRDKDNQEVREINKKIIPSKTILEIKPIKQTIFISSAPEDFIIAKKIYDELKKMNGLSPWLEEEDLLPGQKRDEEIRRVIKDKSSYFLALLSNNALSKKEDYIAN